MKWRLSLFETFPSLFYDKLIFSLLLFKDIYIISAFIAAFFAAISWMIALQKLELSFAYPFMSLNFVVVLLLSSWLLGEQMTFQKVLGVGLIVFGTFIAARG